MQEFDHHLDTIEKTTEGPGVLITTSTSDKVFHTGFDLDLWKRDHLQMHENFALASRLFARLLTFPLPTMCVINGHAFAGGMMLALSHDYRTMRADRGYMCLSEINLNFPIPEAFGELVKVTLPPNTLREVMYGGRYTGP